MQLLVFTKQQILQSDLTDSTVRGTGFGPETFTRMTATGYLQGPPLLVQVVALTEVIRPHKPRGFKFKLSDGHKVVDAFANAPLSNNSFVGFDSLELGCKVSGLFMSPKRLDRAQRIDISYKSSPSRWGTYPPTTHFYVVGRKVLHYAREPNYPSVKKV